ncbi:MAG TPA: hypothetical protein VFL17_02650 [Anaerolineae bacterium]|nr:hypothetical protein [Anaerolineae bacterium]
MNDNRDLEKLERLLHQAATDLRDEFPPTPPIAAPVRRELQRRRTAPVTRLRVQRLARAMALAAAVFAAILLLSPDVREAVARFFGLETVRIERIATVPAPALTPGPSPVADDRRGEQAPPPTFDPSASLRAGLAGLTTLADARARAKFDIRLPAYPPALGQPRRVYVQDFESGQQVILVYPDFALFQSEGVVYGKGVGGGTLIQETTVAGEYALWLSGSPHLIQVQNPDGTYREETARLVEGNVLAWQAGGITYRLETQRSLDEAMRIAESLYTPGEPAGRTTLPDARAQARFTIRLPAYRPSLGVGTPERVYFQDFDQDMGGAQQVILVYPDFVLYEAEGVVYGKSVHEATIVEEVEVGGRPALWLSGAAHLIQVYDASGRVDIDFTRLVEGNVLAWEDGNLTFRIETTRPLEDALRIAESIGPAP